MGFSPSVGRPLHWTVELLSARERNMKASCPEASMLFLVVLLVVLWLLGLVTSYTLGGLLHILLVIAIVLFLVHIIQGRTIGEA